MKDDFLDNLTLANTRFGDFPAPPVDAGQFVEVADDGKEDDAAIGAGSSLFDRGVIWQESRGRQFDGNGKPLTSKAGAIGIAQVMPGTAPEAARLAGMQWDEKRYRNDSDYNASLGRAYFNKQLSTFGDEAMALAAYNAGPGRVQAAVRKAKEQGRPDAWLSYMPAETRDYVPKILGKVYGGGAQSAPRLAPSRQVGTQQASPAAGDDDFLSSLSYEKWAKESGQADQRLIDADLPEPVKDRTGGQMAGDLALSLAQGGVGAVRSLTDLAGADNKASALLDDASKGMQSAKSEYAQQVAAASQQRIEDAKGQGTMAEVSAYLDAIWDAPLDMTAQAAGSLLPFLFTGGAAAGARVLGIANAAKKAGVAKDVFLKSPAGQMAAKEIAKTVGSITSKANIGMGIGMGLGGVKGQQYETTLKEAKAKGLSDEEAKKLATEAQAYGGSMGGALQQLGGAALGGIGAATGPLERALSRIPSAAQPGRGIIGRTLVGGLKEAAPEGVQGAQQAWAGNEAAVGAGVMDSSRRLEGVVGQGVQEAVLSFPMGGAAGAMESGPAQQATNAPVASGPSAPPPTTPATPVTPPGTAPQQPAAPTAQGAQPASVAAQPAASANIATMADADLNALIEAIDATDDDAVTDDQWERYALAITEANRRAAATPPAATTAPTAPAENAAAPAAPLPTYMPGIEINSNRERPKQTKVLQPRQRDSAASVNQMLTNAKNLDWLQVSQSPVLGVGAPVVFGDLPQRALVGAEQPVTDMAGNTIRTRYAIVDASDVIASNAIDGSPVREYETGAPGKLRAIAGNGRKEAINHAYALGVAQEKYLPNLLQEANKFGIEVQPQALEAMQRPMLVRIMDEGDVTDNFGAVTNARIGLDRSDVEQAADDARDFDFGQTAFDERGAPTEDSIAKFIQSLPSNEAGNLATKDGRITAQAERRFMAATFKRAYEDDALVQEVTMETDPDAKRVLDAAMNASGVMAALKGRGEFDLAPAVADAMKIAINAARKKTKLADEAENQDIAISDEGRMVARFLAKPEVNGSSQRMAAALRQWGKKALTQAEIQAAEREGGQGNLLGEPTPTMSRKQLFDELQVADGSVDQSIGEQSGGAAIRAIPAADKNPSQEDSPAADQPQQGDILNNVGEPFKSPKAAEIKAKKDNQGGQVTPVRGGYVVRVPQNMATSATATMGARGQTLTAGPGFTAADVVRRDPIAGQKINDEWTAFSSQSGTLGIPRAQMPQVKATDRGAMVNFLKARGIDSSKEQLPPTALKPTQAEFSPAKVQQAADRTDGDRSIIVSADGYVVDGHHQWLAQRQKGQPVNVIRLDQPIAQVLEALKEMPSAQPERVDAESAQPPSSDSEQNQPVAPANPAQAATENVALDALERKTDEVMANVVAPGSVNLTRGQVRALIQEKGVAAADKTIADYQEHVAKQTESIRKYSDRKEAASQSQQAQAATENVAIRSAKDEIPGESSALAAKQRWEQAKADEAQQAERDRMESDKYNAYVREQEFQAERRRLQGDRTIRQANGKPFKKEVNAQAKLDEFDLADTHAIQQVDGGFVLRQMPPAEQAERQRKAEGRESYTEAQAAVVAEMGIGDTADGEIDATEEQWAEIGRRIAERLGQNPAASAQPEQKLQAQKVTKIRAKELFSGKAMDRARKAVPADASAMDQFIVSGKEDEFQRLLSARDAGRDAMTDEETDRFYDLRTERNQAKAAVENADGEMDVAEAQLGEIDQRTTERLKQMLPAPNPNPNPNPNPKPNQPTAQSQQAQAATENVAPEVGPFGPIFNGFESNPEGAIAKLMQEKRGEVPAAFTHSELGSIAFIYGDESMGLRHIEAKRGIQWVRRIPDILRNGRLERDPKLPRAYLVQDGDPAGVAVIRLDWDGAQKTWLVTAHPDDKGKWGGADKTSRTADNESGLVQGNPSQSSPQGDFDTPGNAAQPRPKGWETNYGAAKQVAESLGIELRGANGKMKKTPELVAEIKAADSTPKQAGASAPEQQKLPPTDIRIGDKVVVDGEAYTVTGPLKDGKKVVGVVASKDSDTNPLYGVREVFLRGDEAIVARIAAQQSLLQSGDQSLLLDTAQEEAATTPAQSKPVSLEDGATKAPEQDKETQGIGRRIAETEKRLEALRKNQSESGSNAWVWDKKIEDAERTLAAYKQAKQSIEGRAPAASSPTQAAQDNGKTPVPASQQDSKGPYATWRDSTFAQRRELLRAAGYTDADQGRVLSGMDWSNLTDPVRNALSAPAKAPAKSEGASAAKPLMQAAQESGKLLTATVGDKKPASKLDAAAALDAPPKPEPKPGANTVFTEDAAEKARARLKAKLGRLNSGIDPEMLMDGITLAGYHIEKGARTFAAYAKAMMDDLGDGVKPYLKSWYMGAKYDPRAAGFDGMSTAADVESADIEQIARESAERPIADADAASPPQAGGPTLKDIFAGLDSSGLPKSAATDAAQNHPQADLIARVNDQFHDLLLDLMETQGVLEVNGYNTETEENKPCL